MPNARLGRLEYRVVTRARVLAFLAIGLVGCTRDETLENSTFYSRKIGPVLKETCSISPTRSGCHIGDGNGNAFGNLSMETYDTLVKRREANAPKEVAHV